MTKSHPTEVTLSYLIPVHVVVCDADDGTGPYVSKVVVEDGASFGEHNRRDARSDQGRRLLSSLPAVIAAVRLVENGGESQEWPAWEFG